jgi:hypothetical protein
MILLQGSLLRNIGGRFSLPSLLHQRGTLESEILANNYSEEPLASNSQPFRQVLTSWLTGRLLTDYPHAIQGTKQAALGLSSPADPAERIQNVTPSSSACRPSCTEPANHQSIIET